MAALYVLVFQIRQEKDIPVFSRYRKAWMSNFKQGSMLWGIFIASSLALAGVMWAIFIFSRRNTTFLFFGCFLWGIFILSSSYWYALTARYTMTIGHILKTSLAFGMRHVAVSAGIVLLFLFLTVPIPIFCRQLIFLWPFFSFSFPAYASTWLLNYVFSQYTPSGSIDS